MGMASESVSGGQKRCELQWKFVVAGLGCHNGLLRYVDFPEVGLWIQTQTFVFGHSSHWYWFSLFLFSNLQNLLSLASFLCLIIDIHFSFLISVNSDEAVTSTNRLKAFILAVFYVLLNRFGFSVLSLDKMIGSIFVS